MDTVSPFRRLLPGRSAVPLRLARGTETTWLEQENARLSRENAVLRQHCADLAASAELWIRLYEAALDRAGRVR